MNKSEFYDTIKLLSKQKSGVALININEFKKEIRGMFIIAKYDLEYTAFMEKDKVYMVKGLNDNIDNIISYKDLPYVVVTSVIPFKNVLTYDGMLLGMGVKMGNGFDDIVEKEYDNMMKYYHL